jgi:hypothetical protein
LGGGTGGKNAPQNNPPLPPAQGKYLNSPKPSNGSSPQASLSGELQFSANESAVGVLEMEEPAASEFSFDIEPSTTTRASTPEIEMPRASRNASPSEVVAAPRSTAPRAAEAEPSAAAPEETPDERLSRMEMELWEKEISGAESAELKQMEREIAQLEQQIATGKRPAASAASEQSVAAVPSRSTSRIRGASVEVTSPVPELQPAPKPMVQPARRAAPPAEEPAAPVRRRVEEIPETPRRIVAPEPAPAPLPRRTVTPEPAPIPQPRRTVSPEPAPAPQPRRTVTPEPAPSPQPEVVPARQPAKERVPARSPMPTDFPQRRVAAAPAGDPVVAQAPLMAQAALIDPSEVPLGAAWSHPHPSPSPNPMMKPAYPETGQSNNGGEGEEPQRWGHRTRAGDEKEQELEEQSQHDAIVGEEGDGMHAHHERYQKLRAGKRTYRKREDEFFGDDKLLDEQKQVADGEKTREF